MGLRRWHIYRGIKRYPIARLQWQLFGRRLEKAKSRWAQKRQRCR